MTDDSQFTPDSYNHFGAVVPHFRVLTTGLDPRPETGALHFVRVDAKSCSEGPLPDADCWMIDAGKSDAILLECVQHSGLPLVAMVGDDGFDAAIVSAADGHVLPGDDDDVVAAVVARAVAGGTVLRVADLSDGTARAMQASSVEAGRIAERLAMLATAESAPTLRGVDAVLVRRIIKLRRDRERFLPAEILADPAWDILLDLMAARLEGKPVPVSSLCIAAAVPTTTALRWIRSLTEAGLLQRRLDSQDARRSHVELSPDAAAAMLAYLRAFNEVFVLR